MPLSSRRLSNQGGDLATYFVQKFYQNFLATIIITNNIANRNILLHIVTNSCSVIILYLMLKKYRQKGHTGYRVNVTLSASYNIRAC